MSDTVSLEKMYPSSKVDARNRLLSGPTVQKKFIPIENYIFYR